MKTNRPLLSVIIVAGPGGKEKLLRCLASIKHSTYKNYEVIVVDNSQDPSLPKAVQTKFPKTKLLIMPENTGVLAFNIGFANAQGEYILALDDDASIKKTTLAKIVNSFDKKSKKIAVLVPNFYNPFLRLSYYQQFLRSKTKLIYTFLGGGVVFRRKIFAKTGYYDSSFFFWYHELDLAVRVLDAGYFLYFDPQIIVFHHQKEDKIRRKKIFLSYRNQVWFNIKNFSLVFLPLVVARDLFFLCYLPVKTQSLKTFLLALSGYLAGWLTILVPLRKRRSLSLKTQKEFLKFYLTNY